MIGCAKCLSKQDYFTRNVVSLLLSHRRACPGRRLLYCRLRCHNQPFRLRDLERSRDKFFLYFTNVLKSIIRVHLHPSGYNAKILQK